MSHKIAAALIALGMMFAAGGLPGSQFQLVSAAVAADPSDSRGDRRRFDQCRDLRNRGGVNWYGIASGTVNNAGGRANRGGFHVKACFASERACNTWVKRIWHEIPHLDELHALYCRSAN